MATEPFMRDVREPYDLECELFPHWIEMRKLGVRIDVERMARLSIEIQRLLKLQEQQLWYEYQIDGSIIASPKKMTIAMNRLGIHSPNRTPTGAESWDVKSLPIIEHPVVPLIMNYKNLDYLAGNKSIGNIKRCMTPDNRLHPIFKAMKRDEGGTVTSRLSCQAPNCQNWPSREEAYNEKAWGVEVRSLILPEEGMLLASPDYSQIEVKVMGHFSVGQHAQEYKRLCSDPNVDLHAETMARTHIESRYICKRISFGLPYGMGPHRMVNLDYPVFKHAATEAGVADAWEYGKMMYNQFKTGFPVLFDLIAHIETTVKQQGYMVSIGGRRHHAPRPTMNQQGRWAVPYYQCVSHVISGSAADILKKGILDARRAGIFKVLPMHLTVHDENCVSMPFTHEGFEALRELESYMRGAYSDRMTVPIKTATECGPNWGYWSKDIYKEMEKGIFSPDAFKRVYAPQCKRHWWCIKNGYEGMDGVLDFIDEEKFTQ
jgi:DNA polymerase-1